jgi:hypothetical protein
MTGGLLNGLQHQALTTHHSHFPHSGILKDADFVNARRDDFVGSL